MYSLTTKNSALYLKMALVAMTIVFGAGLFCGSNSTFLKSAGYKHGGLEEIEFHQALPARLFFHQVSVFCAPAALRIFPVMNLLGPKSSRPKTFYTLIRPCYAFNRAITINAP